MASVSHQCSETPGPKVDSPHLTVERRENTKENKDAERCGVCNDVLACDPAAQTESARGHSLGASALLSHAFEERIAEDAICFSRSVKIPNTCIKGFWIGNARRDRRFTNSLDHRG